MQIAKLSVLVEAGAVREVAASYQAEGAGWTVQVTYASRRGERREVLERQRGGVRVFATLDAVARALAGLLTRPQYKSGHREIARDRQWWRRRWLRLRLGFRLLQMRRS